MAWRGQPLMLDELLFKTQHGLVDQSLHARLGAETTNGDGFGIGWYGAGAGPGVYRSVAPAWGDANLRHLASHIESPLFLAHVRATSGTAIQESNCHPFRHDGWLFVHNGAIADFHHLRRDLMLAVDPQLFPCIEGTTDSEVLFHLALTFGLDDDPIGALERAVGLVEATALAHDVPHAVQASIGVSDGERIWAVRYSTDRRSRTLFTSGDVHALRRLHPDNPRLQRMLDEDRVIVSEPFSDLPGAWLEVPESTAVTIGPGGAEERRPFGPRHPFGRRPRALA